jgi:hypothetical protein
MGYGAAPAPSVPTTTSEVVIVSFFFVVLLSLQLRLCCRLLFQMMLWDVSLEGKDRTSMKFDQYLVGYALLDDVTYIFFVSLCNL